MIFMYIQIVATVSASCAIVRPAVPLANLFVITLIRHEAFGQCFSGERVLLRPARGLHAPEMIFKYEFATTCRDTPLQDHGGRAYGSQNGKLAPGYKNSAYDIEVPRAKI
jgi:hypothetical protein